MNNVPSRPNTSRLPKCSGERSDRTLVIDHLHVIHPRRRRVIHERAFRDRGVVHALFGGGLGIAPVDDVVLRERPGSSATSSRPPWPRASTAGKPGDRRRKLAVGRQHSQASGALGDQHLAARQERHAPRVLQPFGHGDHIERDAGFLFGRVGLAGKRGLLFRVVGRTRIDALAAEMRGSMKLVTSAARAAKERMVIRRILHKSPFRQVSITTRIGLTAEAVRLRAPINPRATARPASAFGAKAAHAGMPHYLGGACPSHHAAAVRPARPRRSHWALKAA